MKDIELGKINRIITKDMSRLGRDYIGTEELIEKYFPNNNIRYIAINDGIDTFIDNTNNDIAPFKAIMNDMYAKDISKKIKSSLYSRMKEGLYVSGRCPFGYMKDPNNKNHLVINEEQAEVVKLIFDLALKGNTYHYIAQYLIKRKIKTPASYYNYVWNTKCINTNCISQEYGVWVDITIFDKTWILDKALNDKNIDLLKIINVTQPLKEKQIGPNDLKKQRRIEDIERKLQDYSSNLQQEKVKFNMLKCI